VAIARISPPGTGEQRRAFRTPRPGTTPWRPVLWLAALALLALTGPAGRAQDAAPPERDLSKPIRLGVLESSFPYQYRDTDGKLTGFSIDLSDAIARVMNLRFELVPMSNTEAADALRSRRVDALQFWSESAERRTFAEFSVPIMRVETIAVVRRNESRIHGFADLRGRRVAVGPRGTVSDRYLRSEQPEAIPVYTNTSQEFLRMLAAGQIDAAVMSRLTAASMIEQYKLRNLTILDDRIPGGDYDVRYCFTVRKGDSLLLARLNEGLAILHRTGQFDEIYHKWFGRFGETIFTRMEVVSYVAVALALGCAVATWGFFRQRKLSRRIARQAAELAEQRSLLAALHEKYPLATLVLEVSTQGPPRLISLNPEAVRLFGLDPVTAPHHPVDELPLTPDLRAYLGDVVARWRRTAQPDQWEARLPATRQLLETSLIPLGPGEADTYRLCVLSADTTQRRLQDHEIAQSRRQSALGELAGGIAHEFNNLLTPIVATTSLLQLEHRGDPPLQSGLEIIGQAANRAAELTRRLLTFGRRTDETPQPVRLADAVANCFALLQPTVDRRIAWESRLPRDLPPIQVNPIDLSQIVFNLVLNARDALVEKLAQPGATAWTPRLRVTAVELPPAARPVRPGAPGRVLAAWQRLTIEDNGPGIPPEIIDRIYEPFFTTKDIGKGAGLGLATVWHLVTDAGGYITVESTVGEGTKFHVTLPQWQEAAVAPKPASPAAPAPVAGPGERILLVEDDPLVGRTAVAVLEHFGHRVTHLLDGAQAWSHLSNDVSQYDLLLLDVNMPQMSGVDLVRRVRGTRFAGRIVVMSGRVDEADLRALKELHVDHILAKPFTPDELTAALGGPPSEPPPPASAKT
jgi:signal transduction histidine kinase/ActR/RegA family two-component response regulator